MIVHVDLENSLKGFLSFTGHFSFVYFLCYKAFLAKLLHVCILSLVFK